MDYKELIEQLRELLPPKVDYAEMVGVGSVHYGKSFVYEAPESCIIEVAATAIETLLAEREADRWISVEEGLPKQKDDFERYNVTVMRSHFPTSTYDSCDSPYDEEFVTTASYDSSQKIWHLDCDECLNALIGIEDAPLNGDFVTHWKPLPAPPGRGVRESTEV